MDPILLGLIAGATFAALELALVHWMRWPRAREEFAALVTSVTNRFATGLAIPTIDIGQSLWVTGLVIGIALSLPVAAVSRRTVGPIGLGAVAGIAIAAIAELTK